MLPSLNLDLLLLVLGAIVVAAGVRGLLVNLRGFHTPWSSTLRVDVHRFASTAESLPRATDSVARPAPIMVETPPPTVVTLRPAAPRPVTPPQDDAALETLATDIAFVRESVADLLVDVRELRRRKQAEAE